MNPKCIKIGVVQMGSVELPKKAIFQLPQHDMLSG